MQALQSSDAGADLDQYEVDWKGVVATVQSERVAADLTGAEDSQDAWLLKMDENELRELLGRVPPVVLKQMRSKRVVK